MDIRRIINEEAPESGQLEYKDKQTPNQKIAKELVALANGGGGTLILGVRETNGEIEQIQNIDNYSQREEAVNDVIETRVEPNLDFKFEVTEVDGKRVVGFTVENKGVIHSFERDNIPVYPIRQGSITGYMHGYQISEYYRQGPPDIDEANEGNKTQSGSVSTLPERERSGAYFIPAPDGEIAEVCLFSNRYYPGNPVRVTARAGKTSLEDVEAILATITDIFTFSLRDGEFTINQSNGAWVGSGFSNFYQSLSEEESRLEEVPEDYELDRYKTEQGVYVANLDLPYSESLMVVYVEPYVSSGTCRHFSINFLLDGFPANSQPLSELAERTDLHVANAHEVTISHDGIANPTAIPVQPIEQVPEHHPVFDDNSEWVSGLISKNPFYNREELLQGHLNTRAVSSVSNYAHCWAHFQQHHLTEDDCEYETQRFIVTDFDEFTEAIPLSLKNVRYNIDWVEI